MKSENKRIAINTIYMYARLFITMIVGLYTSRVVLQVLGVSDYGLYNVVGGILTLFTFISGSLGASTARFINAEMGKPDGNVNKCFNINITLHIFLALFVFLLAETVGLWYVNNKLVIEAGKINDAIFVYQIAIITSCLGIFNTPYSSLFQAFEKFGFLSALDILNTIVRLALVLLLQYYSGNHLRFYSLTMCFTTVNTFVVYHWYSRSKWPEIIRWKIVKGWNNYKPVIVFNNWNLLSTVSFMARSTGADLIINNFFGTAINGAYSISKTINNHVSNFSANFDSASGPQIIQAYTSGNMERCNYLVAKMGRFTLLLFELVFFPLYLDLDFILHLWLKEVPDGVLIFTQLNLILAAVSLSSGGIIQFINATGKIKWFKIELSIIFLLCIPIAYVLYMYGFPPYVIIILFTIADLLQRIIQLVLMRYLLKFDTVNYLKEAYLRPLLIALVLTPILILYQLLPDNGSWAISVLSIVAMLIITIITVLYLGVTKTERRNIIQTIRSKF